MRDRRHRAENSLRLVHAGAVVGLDAREIRLDDASSGDLLFADGVLDAIDRRFLDLEARRAPLRRLRSRRGDARAQDEESDRKSNIAQHMRGSLTLVVM